MQVGDGRIEIVDELVCIFEKRSVGGGDLFDTVSRMPFDRFVVSERFAAGCSGGERDKFRRQHCVRTQRCNCVRRDWRNVLVDFYGYNDGVFSVWKLLALGRAGMATAN